MRAADALAVQLAHTVRADGRWRVFLFASAHHPADKNSPVWQLCDYLSSHPKSPMKSYQRDGDDPDALIDLRVVFQQGHTEFNSGDAHPLLMPVKGVLGLRDYEKIFCAKHRTMKGIFEKRGISRQGCIIVVRPDQYISDVMPLHSYDRLSNFFSRILIAP